MATLEIIAGTGILKYADDDNGVLRIILSHVIGYSRRGDGYLSITTARGDMQLDLGAKSAVTAAIVLLDGQF